MAGLYGNSDDQPWHVVLTTADGVELNLIAVGDGNKPVEFEGALTPVDATEAFRPGGVPREWTDFSAGAGYTYQDERVPNGYDYAENVWTMVPHAAFPAGELTTIALPAGTHSEIRCGFEANGHLYLSTGRYALRVSAGVATIACDFTATSVANNANYIATSVCVYQGNAYWGGYDNSTGDDTTATAARLVKQTLQTDVFTTNATCSRWHVASFNGLDGDGTWAEWLIGTVATNTAFKYTNSATPLDDAVWTPGSADGTPLGSWIHKVNAIVAGRQAPYFLTTGGVRIVQRFGVAIPNITPHWRDHFSAQNGVAGVLLGGQLYASVLGGIDRVTGLDGQLNDAPNYAHPGADLPNENPAVGTTWAMTTDGGWVVAAVYNGNNGNTYLCWGRPRSTLPGQPGLSQMVWHVAPLVIYGQRVTWLHTAQEGAGRRLWIGTRNGADTASNLYGLALPIAGNPLQDLSTGGAWRARTETSTLYLSSNPWSQGAHAQKAIRAFATVTEDCSSNSTLDVYVNPDKAGREQLGATVTESPYAEARILDDINGRQIAPSVDFAAGASDAPPILRSLTIWSGEGIRATTTYRGRFRFAEGVKLRGNRGQERDWDPQAQWELLIGAQGPRPATMIDWKGTTYTVAIEQGAAWKEREIAEGQRYEIDFTMQFTVLSREPAYDDGAVYDGATEYAS